MKRPHTLKALLGAVVLSLSLVACGGYDETAVPSPPPPPAEHDAGGGAPPECGNATRSYEPSNSLEGPAVQDIIDRGRIIAGVSADQLQMGSRNPFSGQIEGFDIDMVDYIAREIFGPTYQFGDNVELKVITPAQRIELLQSGEIDIVARNMTINCERWEQIAFSAEYYRSGQKILVSADRARRVRGIEDLDGLRVCAPAGTTSLQNLRRLAPGATPVVVTNDTDCLLKFQNGEADALTTDDTVLAGIAEQDPYAVVVEGEPLSDEPYGIGVNEDNVDLVRLINSVLVKIGNNGDWQRSYNRWLAPSLGEGGEQPRPVYGR